MAAFPEIERIRSKARTRRTRSRSATTTPTRRSAAKRCATTCGSASSTGTRSAARAPIRSAPACAVRPWEDGTDSVENAKNRARVAFEFMEKLGNPFYAFHDRDVAPEGARRWPKRIRISTRS